MPRPRGTSGADTADAIRAAGVRLLFARGYHAVSMRDLAAEVGIQAPSLYNHVRTKQDLLVDVLERNLTDMLAEGSAALEGIADPRDRLAAFVDFHLSFHTRRREEALICTSELRSLEPANYTRIVGFRRRYESLVEDILNAGVKAGVFRIGDVRIATFVLLSMLTGAATWFRPGGRLTRAQLVAEYTRLALHGLEGAPPKASKRARTRSSRSD